MDHDQLFKLLLHEFFAEFFQLFFPQWAERFDFSRVEWLDKELFLHPPEGERRYLDLVARLPALVPPMTDMPGESWLALVHVEIESAERTTVLRRELVEGYEHLRRQHGLPVLPIGLFLRVGLDGVGWDVYEEFFWEHRLFHFQYPYIGLPALDAEDYVCRDNSLGVALSALMRMPTERRQELGMQAWRRLVQCQNEYRRELLCQCVDSYWPRNEAEARAFDALRLTDPNPEVRAMGYGLMERKWLEGQREFLRALLESRFGPLSPRQLEVIQSLPAERLAELARIVHKAQSLQELGIDG